MDQQKLNEALAFANYRLTLQVQRQNIDATFHTALVLSYRGSIFKVSRELISFTDAANRCGLPVLVDDQTGNVVQIDDPQEFLKQCFETYNAAMQAKKLAQQQLKSARSTAKIVGL